MAATPSRCHGRCETSTECSPDEVWWTASDVGWVVGHSYIVYAPLIYGCTSVMYEGKPVGTPDAGAFWRVIAQHDVARLVHRADRVPRDQARGSRTASFIRARDLSRFRTLFLAGERGRSADRRLGRGAASEFRSSTIGGRPRPAGRSAPIASGIERAAGQARLVHACRCRAGMCACSTPRPRARRARSSAARSARSRSSCRCRRARLPTLWQATTSATSPSYLTAFPGYYQTGDAGFIDDDGYLYVMTRTDDIINVAGASPVDRRDRGGAGGASRCRRMRGDRRRRPRSRARCRSASSC